SYTVPPNLKELEKKLEKVRKEKDAAVQSQEFEKAASLRDSEQRLREELDQTKEKWKEKQGREDYEVTVEDIASVVSVWTGVPVSQLTKTETERLLNMEDILQDRKSTRLNSSHVSISYAVFCLKKKIIIKFKLH